VTNDISTDNPAPTTLPWEANDLFQLKPSISEYGYTQQGNAIPCTREQLPEAIRRIDRPVGLVWTPDSDRLVPPEEIPFLFDAVREKEMRETEYSLKTALIHIVLWPALLVFYLFARHQVDPLFVILLLAFGIVPAAQLMIARRRLRVWQLSDMLKLGKAVRYAVWLGRRRVMTTWILSGLLVLVFLLQLSNDIHKSIAAAGLVKEIVNLGYQTWRLLTCTVLHGDYLHIAFNVLALVTLGRLIEAHAHPIYLSVVFLFSAIIGSLASMYLTPIGPPSVGASGGLMGLIGFLLVMGYRRKDVLPPGFLKSILLSVAFIFAIGLVGAQMIDNAAHLGGFAGGIVLGLVYVTRRRTRNYRLQPSPLAILAGVLCMVVIFFIAGLAVWKISTFKIDQAVRSAAISPVEQAQTPAANGRPHQ